MSIDGLWVIFICSMLVETTEKNKRNIHEMGLSWPKIVIRNAIILNNLASNTPYLNTTAVGLLIYTVIDKTLAGN